jgi:hypothetical protein
VADEKFVDPHSITPSHHPPYHPLSPADPLPEHTHHHDERATRLTARHTRIDSYQYTIPKCIKDGEYLLRIQSLAIHNPGSTPQFYISCAQLKVTGGGSATPSPTVKIPGAFKATDPGYTANVSVDAFL